MITAPAIEPPAIIEEVRWRKRRVIIKATKAKSASSPVTEKPALCTEASPEYCGPDPPVVIYRVLVNPNTFEERWEAITTKGDRLR